VVRWLSHECHSGRLTIRAIVGLSLTLQILTSSVAWSQEPSTREEADRQRREQQAKEVKPYEPNRVERALKFAEDKAIFILDREGFHPKLGTLTTGSGFAYGLGFRDRDLFSNTGALEIWAAGSVKRYWATEARLRFPRLAENRVYLETWASHRDYPEENFFGLGPDSNRDDRSDYAIRTNHFGGRAGVRPLSHLLVGGGIEYLEPRLGEGQNDRFPDVSDSFSPSEAPGLDTRADFLRSEAFIEVDYREPRHPKKGGWYRIDFSHYDDRTAGQFTFNRLDADLRQFIGFLAGRRVIAARLFVSTSDTDAGQTMPFYLMPTLGGNDTLRGFREYRFRGPHAILAQGEYRWEIWSGFDAALFYDAGKVANRREDLDFEDLESDYGIGFRFNTNNGIILRVDAAFGSRDGKHLYIVFGGVF
jgi:outer membrane protein assembly factor BamA